ncbi:MAG: 2,3-bisphosphoglycerate-dependent phosphoglycerate mutase [Candidatus Lokiarchaeota archaeon]|nr:2,3-bisphosphoglycerate-dependent phosphoglycerate mutase [Candidatus Lokiarchaeota archaeon]
MPEKGKTLKIYLFRHGETTYNRDGIFTGWQDPGLTPTGFEQAEKVAKSLKDKDFEVAYHSHLKRSKKTLDIVLKYHNHVKVIEDDRIIERSYGVLQGHTHEEYIQKVGKEQYDIYHRSYYIPPPGGESIEMVEKRVNEFIDELIEKMKKEKINVGISAHGNSMRPFRRHFENLTVEEMMELENPYDRYFEYDIPLD